MTRTTQKRRRRNQRRRRSEKRACSDTIEESSSIDEVDTRRGRPRCYIESPHSRLHLHITALRLHDFCSNLMMPKDRGAELGDVDGPLECSPALGMVAAERRGCVPAQQASGTPFVDKC